MKEKRQKTVLWVHQALLVLPGAQVQHPLEVLDQNEEKSHEKELFAEIKSVIFFQDLSFTISLLYIDFLS